MQDQYILRVFLDQTLKFQCFHPSLINILLSV